MNQFVGLVRIDDVGNGPMFERSDVIESVIAHLMPLFNDLIIEVMVSQHILTDHEERCLDVVFPQRLKDERGRLGNRTIVER